MDNMAPTLSSLHFKLGFTLGGFLGGQCHVCVIPQSLGFDWGIARLNRLQRCLFV